MAVHCHSVWLNRKGMKIIIWLLQIAVLSSLSSVISAEEAVFSAPEEESLYNLAFKAYRDKLYPIAEKQLNEFLKKYPQSVFKDRAYSILGEVYFYEDNIKNAEEAFKKLSNVKGYEDSAVFWMCKINIRNNKTLEAKKNLSSFGDRFPESLYLPYAFFTLGQILFNEGSFAQAAERYEELYIKYTNHPIGIRSWLELTRCFYKMRKYDKAESNVRRFIRQIKDKQLLAEAYVLLAQINERLGLYTRSIKYFHRAIKRINDSKILPQAYYGLGLGYWQIKSFRESSIWFNEFLVIFPQHELVPVVRLRLAECYISLKLYLKAVKQLRQFISDYPDNPGISGVRYWLAEAYFQQGMLKEAESEYDFLIQKYKNTEYIDKAYYGLGWIYYKNREFDKSQQMFHKAINTSPQETLKAEALLKIGDIYFYEEKYEQAIQTYTDILEKYPGRWSDRALYQIGNTYLKIEEFDKAIAAFDTLIYGYPKSKVFFVALYKKGNSLFKKGLYKDSLDCYGEVFGKAVSSSLKERAGFKIGKAYNILGEYEKAQKQFIRLIEIFPHGRNKAEVLYELGLCMYKIGDTEKALRYFQQCVQEGEGKIQLEIGFWIGENFYNKGQFTAAKEVFLNISNRFPKHELADDSFFLSARCSFKLGEYLKAKDAFQVLLQEYPESDLVPDALFGLAESLIFLKEYNDALIVYQKIIKEHPDSYLLYEVYMRQGDVFYGLAKFKEAILSYEMAEKSPYIEVKIQSIYNTGRTFAKLGEIDKAQEMYLKIAYEYPSETDWAGKAIMSAAELLISAKREEEAMQLFKKVANSKYPESTEALKKIKD